MVVHMIVDYSYLYYKYKFQLESGKMRRLIIPVNCNGETVDKDISQVYYSIKEIEGFRRKLESYGHTVNASVCFDMPSDRKHMEDEKGEIGYAVNKYKSNRTKRLSEEDFENIQFVEKLLSDAGHNTYRFEGYEADDIVAHLIQNYSSQFDYTVIYTPDLDLLAHINSKVGVSRYKVMRGYSSVDINNFSDYLEQELKCKMPYNGLILFKATVGDKSDCIDGIKKFGPKAFDKLVDHLSLSGVDWSLMGDYRQVENVIVQLGQTGYFMTEQTNQALESLSLVRPMQFDAGVVPDPIKHSTHELREKSYMRYGMKTLVE